MIPLASCVAVSLMAMFARQNQKSGWVKQRKPVIQFLREMMSEALETEPASSQPRTPPAYFAGQPVDASSFTEQLARLQVSLDRANRPVIRHPEPKPAGAVDGGEGGGAGARVGDRTRVNVA